jgi:membrane protein DedA with SNARE-associated domain
VDRHYEMPDSPTVATEDPAHGFEIRGRKPPGQHTLKLLAAPIIGLIVLSNVGDALAPELVNSHPLQLLAMNARNRNLILVTNQLDALSYYLVGTLRLLLADPLFFLIGYWYGDSALDWMEKRTKTFGKTLRQWERWFGKAAYPIVFLAPNQYICLFAGAAGMSVAGFFVANISGTVVRLYLIRRLGETFEAPIDDLLGFIRDYRTPLLVVSIVLFAVLMVNELRQTRSEVESIAEAIDDDSDELPPPG